MIDKLSRELPIVFSAKFENGDKGTFKYDIGSKTFEKISDFVFYELSYSEDHERIIGAVSEDEFQGIAELDMKDNTFTPIISLSDLNVCAKELGLDEIKYSGPGSTSIHMPKYYKEGYTFFWENLRNIFCYVVKDKNIWHMQIVSTYNYRNYSYFIKKDQDMDSLFFETSGELLKQKIERGNAVDKKLEKSDLKLLLTTPLIDAADFDGIMDMSSDMTKLVYYKEPEIYIYDLEIKKKEHVINQFLFSQYIIDLKFSPDEKYLFYTVGDIPFYWNGSYRLHFFVVDLKNKNKIKLNKWKQGDRFYGIDW